MTQTQEPTTFSDNANFIAARQYLQEGENSILDRFRVVANHVARGDFAWAQKYYDMMAGKKFCPGGRIVAGAGTRHGQMLNCFQGDTIVETRQGQKAIRDLSGEVEVLSQDGVYRTATFRSYGQQELYRVTFANGEVVEATPGHEWVYGTKSHGKYPRAQTTELLGKFVPVIATGLRPERNQDFIAGLQHGVVYGDGSKNTDGDTHHVRLFGAKQQLAAHFGGFRIHEASYDDREQTVAQGMKGELKRLPDQFASDSYWYGFFVGLMATDGNVDDRGSSALFSSEVAELKALGQQLHRFGIKHASVKQMTESGGRYGPRPCYVLRLLKQTMLAGDFIRDDQRASFEKSATDKPKNASLEVVSVEPAGRTEEVFCCEEPETRTFALQGGILTGNCFVQEATEFEPSSFLGVMELAKKLALVTKVGGGNGVNLDVFAAQTVFEKSEVRGVAILSADHPDALTFARGLMTPPNQPDGEKVPTALKNFSRVLHVVSEPISAELRAACAENSVRVMTGSDIVAVFGAEFVTDEIDADISIEVPDNLGGIIDAGQAMVERVKQGLTPIIDLTGMRPEGSPINGSGGTSSGPFSFLVEIFDNLLEWSNRGAELSGPINTLRFVLAPVLRVVRQGGTRRGAGMATISVANPHVLDFLTAKDLDREAAEGDISTFNISILVDNEFMKLLAPDCIGFVGNHESPLIWPDGKFLDDPHQGRPAVQADWLWKQIAQHAWDTGEPGLIFVDRINEHSALKNLGQRYQIRSTNPCGEVPLTVGEPCDLGAINLAAYVKGGHFDWEGFKADIRTTVRFLDDVLDVNVFPLEQNREASQDLRRLGLGVMGLADMLIKLGLNYGSEEGREFVFGVMNFLRREAIKASEGLALERGNYPLYDREQTPTDWDDINPNWADPSYDKERIPHAPRRNVAILTVAPTGTTSMLFDVSSGLEPIFSLFIYRKVGADYVAYPSELFVQMMKAAWVNATHEVRGAAYAAGMVAQDGHPVDDTWDWDKVTEALSANHGGVQGLDWVPQEIRDVFVTAHDVSPLDHVRMQGAVQRAFDNGGYAGNSLSKTINLPNSATVQDVQAAYAEAYATGCKGVTVYRDGSRQFQVLSTSKEDVTPEEETAAILEDHPDILDRVARLEAGRSNVVPAAEVLARYGALSFADWMQAVEEVLVEAGYQTDTDTHPLEFFDVAYADERTPIQVAFEVVRDILQPETDQALAQTIGAEVARATFPFDRPQGMVGWTDRVRLNRMTDAGMLKETYLITVNRSAVQGPGFPSGPVEVILTGGKSGEAASANAEALGRLASIALQEGVPAERVARTLRGIEGGLIGSYEHRQVRSPADLIAVALEVELERAELRRSAVVPNGVISVSVAGDAAFRDGVVKKIQSQVAKLTGARCAACGEDAVRKVQGCATCAACGASKCG